MSQTVVAFLASYIACGGCFLLCVTTTRRDGRPMGRGQLLLVTVLTALLWPGLLLDLLLEVDEP
jgi:hypothetical protein